MRGRQSQRVRTIRTRIGFLQSYDVRHRKAYTRGLSNLMSGFDLSASKFCRMCGRRLPADSKFCDRCGAEQAIIEADQPPTQTSGQVSQPLQATKTSSTAGPAIAAFLIIVLLMIGIFAFVGQPHGSPGSPVACVPHQEYVYVGYVQTLSERFTITEANKIVQVSYDKGILLYTLYLTNDQGQRFDYHYVTDYQLTQTSILTGC
jgi:hypothetical protein